MIKVTNLVKRFGDITAVDGITFEIKKGEVFGLLGPNGAGKSTAINMMVGILKPDGGSIQFEGIGDPQESSVRRQLGNSPQALAIYEELTAIENVTFFGRLYGLSGKKLDERVAWALDLAGLTERRKDRVKTFSGGMKRRLNLVCALVHDPQVVFFDEPTVGVDPQSRNLIFDKIEQLRGGGRTIIYTTHYMEEAQRLCDRVAIIDHGKFLDIDGVNQLIEKHGGDAVVTADLLETPPAGVNLPGELANNSLRFNSRQPFDQVAALNSQGVKFQNLHIDKPNLESVFLNLTGRSLRD